MDKLVFCNHENSLLKQFPESAKKSECSQLSVNTIVMLKIVGIILLMMNYIDLLMKAS